MRTDKTLDSRGDIEQMPEENKRTKWGTTELIEGGRKICKKCQRVWAGPSWKCPGCKGEK